MIANKDKLEVDGLPSPGEFTTGGAARLLNELLRSTKEPQSSAAPEAPPPHTHAPLLLRGGTGDAWTILPGETG